MGKKLRVFVFALLCLILGIGCSMSVSAATIRLSKSNIVLSEGQIYTLKATVTGSSQKVTWRCSVPSKAAVSSTGTIKCLESGKCTIIAAANGVTAKCGVTIVKKWKKLYKQFLKAHPSIKWYYVIDFNKDGEPELVTLPDFPGPYATFTVYAIKNGAVIKAGSCEMKGMSGYAPYVYFETVSRGIVMSGWVNFVGGAWSQVWGVSKGKLISKYYAYEDGSPSYYVGSSQTTRKKCSKSALSRYVSAHLSHQKSYKMIKSTASNWTTSFY